MRGHLVLGVVAGLVVAGASQARAVDVSSGEWVVTSQGTAEGLGQVPSDRYKICLGGATLVPMAPADREVCKVEGTEAKGNTVSWKVVCDDPAEGMKGEGKGRIVYSGDKFAGTMEMSMKIPDEPKIAMSIKLEGKRIGPCKE